MTGHLKNTIARLSRSGDLPIPAADRMTRTERVLADLAAGGGGIGVRIERDESWATVAARIDFADLAAARPRDIRRAINEVWEDDAREASAEPLVAHSLDAERKTFDRELVLAYLRRFPVDHPAFDQLSQAAGIAAERHDWPWRARGRRFRLWDKDKGPATVGSALLRADHPGAVLHEAGLDGDLATGVFVEDALDDVCEQVGDTQGREAEDLGRRLVALFEGLKVGGSDALLAYALLNPWRAQNPSEAHRKAIGGVLVKRIGDPRFSTARWAAVLIELRRLLPGFDGAPLVALLRRWLTETAVRGFFTIVGRTTDNPQQWAARERFWLAYLDAGAITDGWFAFGRRAEAIAGGLAREENVPFGRVVGGADPSHSALILSIGDLRIAEWSHNGACRFWPRAGQPDASRVQARRGAAPLPYLAEYDGHLLRTMTGPAGFEHLSHNSGWETKFAGKIYRESGIAHPLHGRGRDR